MQILFVSHSFEIPLNLKIGTVCLTIKIFRNPYSKSLVHLKRADKYYISSNIIIVAGFSVYFTSKFNINYSTRNRELTVAIARVILYIPLIILPLRRVVGCLKLSE